MPYLLGAVFIAIGVALLFVVYRLPVPTIERRRNLYFVTATLGGGLTGSGIGLILIALAQHAGWL